MSPAGKRGAGGTAARSPPGDTRRPVLGARNPEVGARSSTPGGEVSLSIGRTEAVRGNP